MALKISNINIARIKIISKESLTLKWRMKKNRKLNVSIEVNKEPAIKLIDKRFDIVKDWKKLAKNSNKNNNTKNTSILVTKR